MRTVKKESLRNLWYVVSMLTIGIAIAILLYLSFYSIYPFKPAVFYNNPFPIVNQRGEVHQGDYLEYHIHYEKLMNVSATINYQIVNSVTVTLSPTYTNLPVGKYDMTNRDIKIPENIPPGKAYLVITYNYHINTLRTVSLVMRTEEFVILPKY